MQFPPLPDWFWYPITFIYGAIVGSFLNVVIYRLPLGKSINGSSACPNCNYLLKPWDNIPILGFLMLGGRCRLCRTPISWRYMSVELVTACLWVALYERISGTTMISWVDFVFQALFASVLVAMVFIDLDHFIAPDELNVLGFVLALGRDIACLVLAWQAGTYVWEDASARYAYFHYLPRALPGALVYGGLLFAVSVLGFVYYAREPGESVGGVLRRYFDFSEAEPEADVLPEVDTVNALEQASDPSQLIEEPNDEDEFEDEEPPRLRFSPGFLAILSAGFLATVVGAWGLLALLVPALSFVLLARRPGEAALATLGRFFRSDEDDNYARADGVNVNLDQIAAEEEAAEFAREAETGAHGGMGLGDVKLALAIGALLGPILSIVSLLVATLFGATTGIAIKLRRKRRDLKFGVPFVPFMAAGAIITMLYGTAFVGWYVGLMTPPDPNRPLVVPPAIRRPLRPANALPPLRGVDRAVLPPAGR